jgi:hypothetical protein
MEFVCSGPKPVIEPHVSVESAAGLLSTRPCAGLIGTRDAHVPSGGDGR